MATGNRSWDRRKLSLGALALAAVFFLALHVFSNEEFRNVRLDFTDNHIYTLSDGTHDVLKDLREPIRLRFFVSQDLLDQSPGLKDYAKSVQELLQRYVQLSNGKLTLDIIHPEQYSPEEDRAVGFGLQGVPITQAGNLGYFGLAGTNTTDDTDVIPFFSPDRAQFLEYDLSRLVQNLANPKKKKVGIVSSLPVEADPLKRYRAWQVVDQLKQFFDVQRITLEGPVPKDIDVLLVIHPKDQDDTDRYYIDQYVMRGGKTIMFVDPYSEQATRNNAMQRMGPDKGSDLKALFDAWGITYDKSKVVGDRESAQRVSAGTDALGRPIITDYLAWMTLTGKQINRKDVITGNLDQVAVATAGAIGTTPKATIKMEPLLTTSPQAELIDVSKVNKDPKPAELLQHFKSADKRFVIAARFSGMLKSAFPNGEPKDKTREEIRKSKIAKGEKVAQELPFLKQSAKPANFIVVADTDLLADQFWVRLQDFFGQQIAVPVANNGDFVVNAVDNMAGTSALIGLRSRGVASRPFTRVEDIQHQAELRYRSKEQALLGKLKEVDGKLKDLQTKETKEGRTVILSPDQKAAIDSFRHQAIEIRKELRSVQRALREDIDRLDSTLKIINIGAMPVLVVLFALGLGLVRRRNARRHRAAQSGSSYGRIDRETESVTS
jgi:ABC-type uncharacterized transport system involved in gliding motility auxiliary subunit